MKDKRWMRLLVNILSLSILFGATACNNLDGNGDGAMVESQQKTTNELENKTKETDPTVTDKEDQSTVIKDSGSVTDETWETASLETTEEKSSEVTEITTEPDVQSTEKPTETESETFEPIYSYDFADDSWKALFETGGGAARDLADDPAGGGEKVLSISHNASQAASWVRNKTPFVTGEYKKYSVEVDLYIPSSALSAEGDYVQMQINGDYNHHVNLVSDAKSSLTPFDTKNFPRDKWFTLRFSIDMEKVKYNLEIVEDGEVYSVVFSGRSASSMIQTGPLNLRVFLSGKDQTVYIDNHGLEAGVRGDSSIVKSAKFIRIDGINAVGQTLSLYGDFAGGAKASDLSEIVWEKCDIYSGSYSAISGANGVTYVPKDGGYYLRVSAKLGKMSFTSLPVYIRETAECGFVKPYLTLDGSTLTAAVVYNNEFDDYNAEIKVVIYEGTKAVKTLTESFKAKSGSDLVIFNFDGVDLSGKRAELAVYSNGQKISDAVEVSDGLPKMLVRKTTDGTSVLANKKSIANFRNNRYMTFRPSIENDHWIGTENNPIDMGFAYQESAVAGLTNTEVQSLSAPGVFKVVFIGKKANVDATQINELIGFWNAEKEEFSYIYNCSMTADTETWHSKSNWAPQSRIEPFDYHLERMSILDRVYNNNQNGDLYDYVIYENGEELIRIPKLPVPRTAIKGTYFYGFFLSHGESVYYPDANEGGWKSTVLSDTGDTYVEICWSWYDIHSCSENSVPQMNNCESFTVSQSWLFTTTTAEHDRALINAAVEVEWRDLPNYQLPLFSTENTFETQFGGTDWQYAWWKSTYDCTMDAEVGHDGAGSVKIQKTTSGEASWYTEGVWGFPYSFDKVEGNTYRFSGYIKTENVVGEAYIANIQYAHPTPDQSTEIRSQTVTGTTDWTYVSFTFTGQQRTQDGKPQRCIDHFFLTLNGTGTVWFDDVKIEEVN